MDTKEIVDKKLVYWRKKLIDLSKRNNLVSYRFTKSKSIRIISPDIDQAVKDLDHEENINISKKASGKSKDRLWTCSEDDSIIDKKLTTLYFKAKDNFQELGLNTCFVSLGMLKYKDSEDSDVFIQAPIMLYQVEISRLHTTSKDNHAFDIDSKSGDLQLNPAIKEKLHHDFGIELKEIGEKSAKEVLEQLSDVVSGMKGWSVNNEVYIDIFSYQKYIMYEDLNKNKDLVEKSALVQAYVGDRSALQDDIAEAQREEFDDATSIDVLPSDSSQKKAIELAKSGVTFVLQGPPGTGKSQTIVNIIASLMQANKKVLFVSQKMAALNVVQKRLDDVGLGRYCLNLHNYRGNKKEIIKQLMSELTTSPHIKDSVRRIEFDGYLGIQRDINKYYDFLCSKHKPLDLSVYEIRGELSKLHDAISVDQNLSDIIKLSRKEFDGLVEKMTTLSDISGRIGSPLNDIFFKFKGEGNTTLNRSKLTTTIRNAEDSLKAVNKLASKLSSKTGLKITSLNQLASLSDIESALEKPELKDLPDYLVSERLKSYVEMLSGLKPILDELASLRRDIDEKASSGFIKFDTKTIEKTFKETSFLGRITNKDYKTAKKELDGLTKAKLDHGGFLKLLESKDKHDEMVSKLDKYVEKNSILCKELNDCRSLSFVSKLQTTATGLSNLFTSIENIGTKHPSTVVKFIISNEKSFRDTSKDIKQAVGQINSFFEQIIVPDDAQLSMISETMKSLKSNFENINDVLLFKEIFKTINDEVRCLITTHSHNTKDSKLIDSFLKTYYLQVLDDILKKENKISPKDQIERFRADDVKVRDAFRFKVMDIIEENQPKDNYHSAGSNEVYILKRENEKKRKLKPIKDLLEEISTLVFTLKPCFMMSPLTVSQYINPSKMKFDVVIFDEASQIMPEDAVPCLIRAKQAIVMGDTQQLPPTTFFSNQDEDDDTEEQIEDLESFLSEASTKFRTKTLDWHYRSKNENLIAFSNRFFYDNRLITFPNPKENDQSGLEYINVKNGVYDRGNSRKNREEARKVVETYKRVRKEFPSKSIGIIAFSIAQENAIREEFAINALKVEESIDPNTEETFIKNLETVQGDERDIIIISVGYGKDSSGKFSYNFGPINKEGGYKRLNVAVTRSRLKTIILSSILPEEMDDNKINAEGMRHLKCYLDYAKNKNLEKFATASAALEFDSTFEEVVYDALVKAGFSVNSQVGCSGYRIDLAIKHPRKPGEYILGIECDGAQYHSSRYARDRDKIRQLILESLGWNIQRIWSEDWLNNREREIEKIKNKVDALLRTRAEKITTDTALPKVEIVEDFKEVSLKSKYEKYKIANSPKSQIDLKGIDQYGNLRDTYDQRSIKQCIISVLEIESPMEKELLFKRVIHSCGVRKLGKRIDKLLSNLLDEMADSKDVRLYGDTVSLKPIDVVTAVRISTEEQRPFVLVPKEELAGAAVDIIKNTFSISKEALMTDIAKGIYDNNRKGKKIEKKISIAIKHLMKNGVIEESEGKLRLVAK